MKKLISGVLLAALLSPTASFARDWRPGYGYAPYPRRTVVIKHKDHTNGAAIAAGVLGGIATGLILSHIFTPPSVQASTYPPPTAPAPPDPYDAGYSDGYSRGVERGRYERYEQGRSRGYTDGYENARAGRAY
jgi:hypothetical protein